MNKILEEYRKTLPKDTTFGDVVNDFDINFIDYPLNIPIKNAMQTIVCSKLKISKKEIMYIYFDEIHHKNEDTCDNEDNSTDDIYNYIALKKKYRLKKTKGDQVLDKSIDLSTCRGKYICIDFKRLYNELNDLYTNNDIINEEKKIKVFKELCNAIYDYRKRNNLLLFFLSADMTNHHINIFLNEIAKYKLKYMFYNFDVNRGTMKLPVVRYNSKNEVDIKMTISQWAGINEKIGSNSSLLKANFDRPPTPTGRQQDILDKAFFSRFLNIRYSPEVEKLIETANDNNKSLSLSKVVEVLGLHNVKKDYAPKIDALIDFIEMHQDGKHVIFTLFDDYYRVDYGSPLGDPEKSSKNPPFKDYSDYGIKLLIECFKNIDKMTEKDKTPKIPYLILDSKIEENEKRKDVIKKFNTFKKGVLITSYLNPDVYTKLENIKYFHVLDVGIDFAYDIYLNALYKGPQNPNLEVRLWTLTNPDETYSLDKFFKDQFYVFVKKCNEDYLERVNKNKTINISLDNLKLS